MKRVHNSLILLIMKYKRLIKSADNRNIEKPFWVTKKSQRCCIMSFQRIKADSKRELQLLVQRIHKQ